MVNLISAFILFSHIYVGYLVADIWIGMRHWFKDTYFNPYTPFIGKYYIWGAWLHHVKPMRLVEIPDYDLFIDIAKWNAPVMLYLIYISNMSPFFISMYITMCFSDIAHKYCHFKDGDKPLWILILQRLLILQDKEEHHVHHILPYSVNYCMISPFINGILEKHKFWRRIENFIENNFGIKPRSYKIRYITDKNYPGNVKFILD